MNRAVFFDRDDTFIKDKVYLNDPNQVEYIEGAFSCFRNLQNAGFKIIVVTNQSGIPRGLVQISNLNLIHAKIRADFAREAVDISGFYYAQFLPGSSHPLRKPNPGMLLQASIDHGIDLKQSWMVGDRHSDVEAGFRAGTRTILFAGSQTSLGSCLSAPDFCTSDLAEVAQIILKYS